MAVKDLLINILADDKTGKAFDSVGNRASGMGQALGRAGVAANVALGGLAAAAFVAGDAAAEAEQAAGAVESVFGAHAEAVELLAASAAKSVGLAKTDYSNLAATLGAQLGNMGVPTEKLVGTTDELITMGADLAATFGGTTSEAVSALSSLLRGERDPIERYGVSIKQADIDARLAALGLGDLEGAAANTATTQATLALLTEQTAKAQGQFARETDTAAGSAQIAKASFADASAALGEQLVPVMAFATGKLAEFAGWAGENKELVTVLAVGVGGLAVAVKGLQAFETISGAMGMFRSAQVLATAATTANTGATVANNLAWLASPVTWIVLGIIAAVAGLVAAGIWLVQNWDGVSKFFGDVWTGLSIGAGAAADWIGDRVSDIVGFFTSIPNRVGEAWNGLIDLVKGVMYAVTSFAVDAWNNTLGGLSVDLPWFLGGAHIEFPTLSMPALAAGGIVSSATVALIGEAGPEAVVPLDRMGEFGYGAPSSGPLVAEVPVEVVIDGHVLARVLRRVTVREAY